MSDLTFIERKKLGDLFNMASGYVLEFEGVPVVRTTVDLI